MQTTPLRQRRTHTQAATAPFSRTAAKLIEQIQADARAALLEELSAKDGITVLHTLDAATRRLVHEGRRYSVNDSRGAQFSAHRDHVRNDTSWASWHPAHWLVSVTLVDGTGADWYRLLGTFVCDDFGNLVEVPR